MAADSAQEVTQLLLAWRNGDQAVGPAGEYRSMQLSPDGGQVLLDRNDPQAETSDIWKFDLPRETRARLTSSPATDTYPVWSLDGSQVAFVSHREGFWGIYRVGGDEKEELLFKGDQKLLLTSDWSSDGKFIVYRRAHEKTGLDIEVLPLFGDRQPRTYLATPFEESYGMVSPDGRWLAYQSNDSGRLEIEVQSFPEPGRKVTVSQGGGMLPRWRRDGKELYYVAADDKLMAVPVESGASFRVGAPIPLFDVGSFGRRINRYVFDVSRDGRKFLVIRPLEDASMRPLTVVQNWTELLKR
jgi:eukaryotic-like serine/threonine-protein kinase